MKYCPVFFITVLFSCGYIHPNFKKQGGIRIVMEASEGELLQQYMHAGDSIALVTINEAYKEYRQHPATSFYDLYFSKLEKAAAPAVAGSHFDAEGLSPTATAAECTLFFDKKLTEALELTAQNLVKRVNGFGIGEGTVNKGDRPGLLVIELYGDHINTQRVRKLLQSSSKLEFWETYENTDTYPLLQRLNEQLAKERADNAPADTVVAAPQPATEKLSLREQMDAQKNTLESTPLNEQELRKKNPLFAFLTTETIQRDDHVELTPGPVLGYADYRDTAKINALLNSALFKNIRHPYMKFLWAGYSTVDESYFRLIGVKTNTKGEAALSGNIIESAGVFFEHSSGSSPQISMTMTKYAAGRWQQLTRNNIGHSIAISLDGQVYSFPTVMGEIRGGVSSITGSFTIDDAHDLANVLSAGNLPISMHIVEESVIAPAKN